VLHIDGYNVFRADRNSTYTSKGGGICVWIQNSFTVKVVKSSSSNGDVEILLLEVFSKRFSCLVATVYFPHGSSLNHDKKELACYYTSSLIEQHLDTFSDLPVFVLGDFNRVYTNIFESNFGLGNTIYEPTRKDAILDVILIPDNFQSMYLPPAIYPPLGSSDHVVILLSPMPCYRPTHIDNDPYSSSYTRVMDLRDSNLAPTFQYLRSLNYDYLFSGCDLEEKCLKFYGILRECISRIPYDIIKTKRHEKPWINATIKVLINKRYAAYRSKNWPLYDHFRKKVKSAVAAAKTAWGNKMRRESNTSIWDIHKKVIGEKPNHDWLPKADPSKTIADILDTLNKNFLTTSAGNTDSSNHFYGFPLIVPFQFRASEVEMLLSKVDSKKSPGSDGIPSIIWSKLSSVLSYPLCCIFNECLLTADMPRMWKSADVVPIPKTKNPSLSAVRPISLLPVPARIFEKALLKIYKHQFLRNTDAAQFGYRPKSSTTTALLDLTSFIATALSDSSTAACHVLAIDLEKGFDNLSHRLVIEKMLKDNFDPFIVAFVQNYLRERYQCVRWKHLRSSSNKIISGVPQGSSIGPLLFTYFVSDLNTSGLYSTDIVRMVKYADDITLCGRVAKTDAASPITDEYRFVTRWTENNLMRIKKQKCQQIVISRKATQDNYSWTIPDVELKDEMKLLGVIFDKKLGWKEHVEYTAKKASSRIYILRQLKPFLPTDSLTDIYYACIRSILEYCAPLFCNFKQYQSKRFDSVQKRCHKIICGSSECLCSRFVPLTYRRTITSFKLFRALVNDSSHPLHHLAPSRLPYTGMFRIPVCTNNIIKKSFIVEMCHLANKGFTL
jgi:hypothetical protein